MEIVLGPLEARVIGCLIEKEICTPDQYPLSLNALVNACNQKSNREPVLELAELDIRAVIDELIRRRLVVNSTRYEGNGVDDKLLRLTADTGGTLLTADYNLAKVAEVQELKVRGHIPETIRGQG